MPEQFNKAFRHAHRVSPSQADTISLCERKWGFEKLDGLPRPPNPYAQFGLDAHDVLEAWQKTGQAVDLTTDVGKVVSAGLKFLPRPGTHATEYDFVFDTGLVVFHGRIDLRSPFRESVQRVWDHKTTGSFNWLKTPQVLRRDPQAIIYAIAALEEAYSQGLVWRESLEHVELNWVYYLRNPDRPRSRRVQLNIVYDDSAEKPTCPENVRPEHYGVMTLAELNERFAEMEEIGLKILSYHYNKLKAMDLPYNVTACSAYGGCFYQDNPCTLTLSERIEAMEAQEQAKNLTLSEKIRQNLGAAQQTNADTSEGTTAATAPAADPIMPAADQSTTQSPASPPGLSGLPAGGPSAPPGLANMGTQPQAQAQAQPQEGQEKPNSSAFKLVKPEGATTPPTDQSAAQPAAGPDSVNAPEKDKGVDPDGPTITRGQEVGGVSRAEMAKEAMKSLIEARVYSVEDNRFEVKISNQAVKLADIMFATLAKR